MSDAYYMDMCLKLAARGGGKVSPNPMVGCLVVKGGRIVGKGYHRYFGGPHAEVYALKAAGKKARGATLYVNLEPCCHTGKKTPPCAPMVAESGIRRAVIAMKDPNRQVSGGGIKRLKKSGVKCEIGVLGEQARELNRVFVRNMVSGLPYVTLKTAMSLDGKIASFTGDSRWITSPESRKIVHSLRSFSWGIMVGVNTVIMDNPALTSHGAGRDPIRIVVDPSGRAPAGARIYRNDGNRRILVTSAKLKGKLEVLRNNGVEVVNMHPVNNCKQGGRYNFKQLFKKLYKIGIYSLLIEGGGGINASALEAGVVDEAYWFIAPRVIGGRDAVTPVEGRGAGKVEKAIKMDIMGVRKVGRDILVHGRPA